MATTKLTNKVFISQAGKQVMFRLSDKELKHLRIYSQYTRQNQEYALNRATMGSCYNFSMFAFFDYDTTRSKAGRFHANFNYHDGDFNWFLE